MSGTFIIDEHNVVLNADELDDGSAVINIDYVDNGDIVQTGGYIIVRNEDGFIITTVINANGDVVQETVVELRRMLVQEDE